MSKKVVEGKGIEVVDPEMLDPYAVSKALQWLEENHLLEWNTIRANSALRDLHELSKGINPRPPEDQIVLTFLLNRFYAFE
ncbi:MAG: hypothetical protein OXG26_02600 [Caldilineaceae bacterium]|nr:hypothetical protein [Caldilineaceae bacterium]MXZ20844.1 hypothetical protein [Caldilineaceae bacterium SB0665_bin_25]